MRTTFLLLLALLSLCSLPLQAQEYFTVGPKAGYTVNHFNDLKNDDNITFDDFKTISAGIFARIELGRLYLQPEAYFLVKGANYTRESAVTETGKIRIRTLEAPVLLGYYLVRNQSFNIRGMIGPVFNLHTKESKNELKAWDPERYDFNKKIHSLQAGVGIDVFRFTVDARYEYGLSKVNTALDIRPSQFTIGIGYKLL